MNRDTITVRCDRIEILSRRGELAPNVRLESVHRLTKITIFGVQRRINEYREEPLLAIIPGVALQELWDLMSVAENVLRVVSSMVVVTGLLGMLTVILSSLEARRREMAVLRSVGARPLHVFALFMSAAWHLRMRIRRTTLRISWWMHGSTSRRRSMHWSSRSRCRLSRAWLVSYPGKRRRMEPDKRK